MEKQQNSINKKFYYYQGGSNVCFVTAEKETETSIWVRGNRRAKVSAFGRYFETFDEAKEDAVTNTAKRLRDAQEDVKRLTNQSLDLVILTSAREVNY